MENEFQIEIESSSAKIDFHILSERELTIDCIDSEGEPCLLSC